jgi:DNA-binding transcriptional LysR family regulator
VLIDLVQLRTFVAVAEEQHLTRAAERLHISQSAASAHVRAIEESLDLQLFVHANRSLELTRAGQLLLARAKSLLGEATLLESFAREIRGKIEGHLVVASGSEPGPSRLGKMLGALRARHPLISVELRARPSSGTRQGLKTGELDVGLLLGRAVDAEFACYQLTTVRFRVAGPVAWKREIEQADWKELANLPWITPTDSSIAYSSMLGQLFEERGLELNSIVQFDNAALGREALEAGMGMMLMRDEQARQGVAKGSLALSPIAHAEIPLLLAHLASRRADPLIDAFLGAATEVWQELRAAPAHAAR